MATIEDEFAPVVAAIEAWLAKGYYPGAALLVAQEQRVLCERYFGDYTPGRVIYLASAGKWLAAATVAALVDAGKLSWDDPVRKWLPEFADAKGRATLRQLLSHTAGFPAYQPARNPPDDYQTLAESVAHICPLPAASDPGAHFHYGGLALQVAGRMAELAAGCDWETLFQETVARPLGMKYTAFTPVDPGHIPMIGGGARGTLRDYGHFLAMLRDGGVFGGTQVLSPEAVREILADQVRGAAVRPSEFVERARGERHTGLYGLGCWRERLDAQGAAVLVSSPSWAGTYPWVDKARNVSGVFLTHVDGGAAARDGFQAFYASPILSVLVAEAVDATEKKKETRLGRRR